MRKIFITICAILIAGLGWFFYEKPQPPFGAVTKAKGWNEQLAQGEESLFAEVDSNGVVLRIVVASAEYINSGALGSPKNWVRTYSDGKVRGNYAGKDYKYDNINDVFIPPKPNGEWTLNSQEVKWEKVVVSPVASTSN